MKTLIRNVKIVYPGHAMHRKTISLITDGKKFISIGDSNPGFDKEIDAKNMFLFPGLVDLQCVSGEPGNEDKEDFQSLTLAAKAGGFTELFLLPNTLPVTDTKSEVTFIKQVSGLNGVKLNPYGAISKGAKGIELSEMYDMYGAGAKAFTDGKKAISDVNMMKRALHYVKGFGGMVCSFPNDERLSPGGLVNESPANTLLGIKTKPSLAEELMLNRDVHLLGYSDSRLHVSTISTAGSVRLVADAKSKKLRITAGVAMANLLFNDQVLKTFDTNFKTNPPLRDESARLALIEGLNNGTIDVIVTDHTPEVIENKDVEFDQAADGMTMLETFLAAYNTYLSKELSWDEMLTATAINPRRIFATVLPEISENSAFDFTLFDPTENWIYDEKTSQSKGKNSPFYGKQLTGKVIQLN